MHASNNELSLYSRVLELKAVSEFVYTSPFSFLQKIPRGPFCKQRGNCSMFPKKAHYIVELPQHLSVIGPYDLSCSVKWAQFPLRITVLITPSGSACVGADAHHDVMPEVTLKSWQLMNWLTHITISPAPYIPLWQTWDRKAKSLQEEQCFCQKLATYNWINSFIREKPGEGR